MHAPHRLMHACTACIAHGVTAQCMQLLHGLCCFDFTLDIPLSPATLVVKLYLLSQIFTMHWQTKGIHVGALR
jgi:hypothetical protein